MKAKICMPSDNQNLTKIVQEGFDYADVVSDGYATLVDAAEVCMYFCMYFCMYVFLYVCMYFCMYVCMYFCMYVYMYVCVLYMCSMYVCE